MKNYWGVLIFSLIFVGCVPAKKYNELLQKEQECSEELTKFKTAALDNEAKLKTIEKQAALLKENVAALKRDTSELGQNYRNLQAQYRKATDINETLESELERIKNADAKELARMRSVLEAKIIETQRKEDALHALENELKSKEKILQDREQRVQELEEMIARKDMAVKQLQDKISMALRGFEGKGLTVEERNGKIYVSLEAKLLFASGSTIVEPEGKRAVIQLAKAIEGEDDLEIIVEGHTDSDALNSRTHPKNNWELSVLRATSVIDIMTSNTDINPAILMAAGRSKYHPVDEFDKAKNRRIEVIISPNLDELFKMISN
ncbi:MAG: OmpA family protein [Brumimicrobium sp.]|nr:OmpA family protein [Brumimicrobium sp.]